MTIQEALRQYNLPFNIVETQTGGGFTTHKLSLNGSGATLSRLNARINELSIATDKDIEVVQVGRELFLRYRTGNNFYNYFDYAGYIDFNSPDIPYIVGFNNAGIKLDTIKDARHILVAGTTGSGKSVFLHNLILTFVCNPNNYLYLVDCKMVEFSPYKYNARLATEVFGEDSAAKYTAIFIEEMENRYRDMERCGVNEFSEYRKIYPDARRYILVIDELADLISDKEAKKCIIPRLQRIAQKGRAAGFHLVIATQRPDHDVVNGTLKENIPTRAAFMTNSGVSSRIILDQNGAQFLSGNGDLLYLNKNKAKIPERVQAPYLALDDIRRTMTA